MSASPTFAAPVCRAIESGGAVVREQLLSEADLCVF